MTKKKRYLDLLGVRLIINLDFMTINVDSEKRLNLLHLGPHIEMHMSWRGTVFVVKIEIILILQKFKLCPTLSVSFSKCFLNKMLVSGVIFV